jgi:glucose-1-phosphate cytidylyltransferase
MIPVVIMCGGTGTRLREMSEFIPKPLIPIGGTPMVVHIMRWYMRFGFKKFVLALGYKQDVFKQYFVNYDAINNDIVVDIGGNFPGVTCRYSTGEGMEVILSDTGEHTLKGGRLKRIEKYIDSTFMVTYGDGLGDIDIRKLLEFHYCHGKMVTVTGVHPVPRFGELVHDDTGKVVAYKEKQPDGCLTNGGFMVMNRGIFDYLTPDCDLEAGPLELLAAKGELMVYEHRGQWNCMDTLKDTHDLQVLWESGLAKWRM